MGTSAYQPGDTPVAPQGDAFLQALHAAYKSGHLPTQIAAQTATDPERYAADRDPYATFGDRLAAMAERGAQGIPGGQQVMTGTRAAITGEPWTVASQHVQDDADMAGQNAPGVHLPMHGGRVTLADLPTLTVMGGTAVKAGAAAGSAIADAAEVTEPQVVTGSSDLGDIIDDLIAHGGPSQRALDALSRPIWTAPVDALTGPAGRMGSRFAARVALAKGATP